MVKNYLENKKGIIKKKDGYIIRYRFYMFFAMLLFSISSFSQKVYEESGGIVMMEAENTISDLDLWATSTYFSGYSGSGHLEFTGGVVSGAGSPLSPVIYKFKINTTGDYALNIRGRSRLLSGEANDLANDAYFKVEGDYAVGTGGPPNIGWMNEPTKLFVGRGGNGDWGWGTKYDINHVQPSAIFNFKAGETYTLSVYGRSQRFNLDRILFISTSNQVSAARALTEESTWFDDGGIAERYLYNALLNFSNINSGEVPYYKDNIRGVLGINASVEADRDKFAKAETSFTGKNGTYNVKLTTLAEFDGECTYHFLVNGVVKGVFKNPLVALADDYELQTVVFEGIEIKQGDVVAVASNTHTNGMIPEGDGTAWARGRWKSIKMTPTVYQGRVAVVADGNYRDSDDIAGTPVSLAILRALGLENKLVHYSHSCDLVPGANDPGGAFREVEMQITSDGTASRWGGFDHITFFNCQTQKVATIADLKDKINASTEIDPLWIIEAGEPDIIWEAMNLAEVVKRKFVYIVSHHPANDKGDVYDLSDVMALGIPSANLHAIPDQNSLLKKPLSDWYWARDYTDSRINWLWDRGFHAQTLDMNYPAIIGKFDCSDAGMVYYWATIKEGGDIACDVPKLQKLFSEYIPVIPPDAQFSSPAHETVYQPGSTIEVIAVPNIEAEQITSIELFVNEVSVRRITTAPYTWGLSGQEDDLLEGIAEGIYVLKLLITNVSNETSTASVTVSCQAPIVFGPYSGTPINVPGIVQVEDYNLGGEGIAFHDSSTGNAGEVYRNNLGEDVDISVGGSGFISGSLSGDEYTRYSINVTQSGRYHMAVNYKTYAGTSKPFAAYVLPIDLSTSRELFVAPVGSTSEGIINTGGAFLDYNSTSFDLTVGAWVLELRIPSGGAGPNYDYVTLVRDGDLGTDTFKSNPNKLVVFPIPSKTGIFNLNRSSKWGVYTTLGTQILKGAGKKIDISSFVKGLYILKTETGNCKSLMF